MSRNIELPPGLYSANSFDIEEGFMVQLNEAEQRYTLMANLGSEKFIKVFRGFSKEFTGALKWHVEIRSGEKNVVEKYYKEDPKGTFWDDIEDADLDLFLQDGQTDFAVVHLESKDEAYMGRLKVLYMFAQDPKIFKKVLKREYIRQASHLCTLWGEVRDNGLVVEERPLISSGVRVIDLIKKYGFTKRNA